MNRVKFIVGADLPGVVPFYKWTIDDGELNPSGDLHVCRVDNYYLLIGRKQKWGRCVRIGNENGIVYDQGVDHFEEDHLNSFKAFVQHKFEELINNEQI